MELTELGATAAAAAIRNGSLTSRELVEACLARIAACDGTVRAWAFLDPEYARTQAAAADLARREGRPTGPLHGVPVGVKDVFDTIDMPTEDGTVLHAGRRPRRDAAAVASLRAAGAVILGKTVTTELAVYAPGPTANPAAPGHTPGGSSSGSAAAVAAGMVPLAIGTQTNGSVIRPASFCGVVGFKPSRGTISRTGVLCQSRALDQVGVFARSVEDAALAAETLMAFDPEDPAMRPQARPTLAAVAAEEPPVPPRLAFVKTPVWDAAEADTVEAFEAVLETLGPTAREVALPAPFGEAVALHQTIMETDLAVSFAPEYERGSDRLSAVLRQMLERGGSYRAVDYARALARIPQFVAMLDEIFEWHDAIITPAAPGEPPPGLDSTGSPIFCTIWTLCGVPAVSVPLLQGSRGLPMGIQVVGPPGDDARLLRTARWLAQTLSREAAADSA